MKIAYTENQLEEVASQLLHEVSSKVLCLYGPMGSGKTTLIKAMVQKLKGKDKAHSPTFGIVNEYYYETGGLLGYHFDFYRLEEETEALDLGLDYYFEQDVWIFIEWPEKIPSLLPSNIVKIQFEVINPVTRKLSLIQSGN